MATVVLDAYSKAYPSITNRIRASITLSNDVAIIDSIIETGVHNARVWHFPGLPRNNYSFSLDEIDGSGVPINNLALFDVVPGTIDGTLVRDDEQIQVDTTTGFDSGLSSVTFDGTGGKPNYIGWEIVPSELDGRGILKEGLDYTWNKTTGEMVWLQVGDTLQTGTYYNIHFNPIINPAGNSVPTINDFTARIIVEDDNILVEDFGNTIIVEPSGVYLELQLPDITTVPQGRALSIETKAALGYSVSCVKILKEGATTINFLRGNLLMMNNESLQIYRFNRGVGDDEWRVRYPSGNFATVGQSISDDFTQVGVFCKQLLDGSIKNKYQYARIYEEVVLNLPGTQVVNYDDWATGNNKYFFSLANSANPANADKFYFPDRRGLFERNNNSGKSGDYRDDQIKVSNLQVTIPQGNSYTGSGGTGRFGRGSVSPNDVIISVVGTLGTGDETSPKQYLINKYCLI